jgi:hypothetical protein
MAAERFPIAGVRAAGRESGNWLENRGAMPGAGSFRAFLIGLFS